MNPSIYKVHDIDWSRNNIFRAGIIPIYQSNNYSWLGFGVSRFSSNIITIGGTYESQDLDLLDTAIREYNEEVGDNLPHITLENVSGCFAVQGPNSIEILMPINSLINNFIETDELYTIIWLTTQQVEAMIKNRESMLLGQGERTKAYIFGHTFKQLYEDVIYAINNNIFNNTFTGNFHRRRKINTQLTTGIIEDIVLLQSSLEGNIGYIFFTIINNKIGVTKDKNTIFIFNIDCIRDIAKLLEQTRSIVLTNLSEFIVDKYLHKSYTRNIKLIINDDMIELPSILNETSQQFIGPNEEISYIVNILTTMQKYELQLYEIKQKTKYKFSNKRAIALVALNKANTLLRENNLSLNELAYKINKIEYTSNRGTYYTINTPNLIKLWIKDNVLVEHEQLIKIPNK